MKSMPSTFHGYVVHWSGFPVVEEKFPNVDRGTLFAAELTDSPTFQNEPSSFRFERLGWKTLSFRTDQPLQGEDPRNPPENGWHYSFICRANSLSENIILGAETLDIMDEILRSINRHLTPKVRNVAIHVDTLAKSLLADGDHKFLITHLLLDCPKYGAGLKTMSLYGDDISQARDLKLEINEYRARQIGLRSASSTKESAWMGSNGYVKFYASRLKGIEACLGFVRKLDLYVG